MESKLIVLTYHGIHDEESVGEADDPIYSLTKSEFSKQMDYLASLKYLKATTFNNISSITDSSRIVVLTFDDGLASASSRIWPILLKRGLTAVFFISPALIGQKGYLKWDDVRAMSDEGAEFGTHGLYHKRFSELEDKELFEEIVDSKKNLQDKLKKPVLSLALPGGSMHPHALEIAKDAGYKYFCTSQRAINSLPLGFIVRRFPIKRSTPWCLFKATVLGNHTAEKVHHIIDNGKEFVKKAIPVFFSKIRTRIK